MIGAAVFDSTKLIGFSVLDVRVEPLLSYDR